MIVKSLNKRIQQECAQVRYKNFDTTVQELTRGGKQFWKISRHLRNSVKHNPPLEVDGNLLISPMEKARILADSFSKAHNNTLPGDPITNMEVGEMVTTLSMQQNINEDWSTYSKPQEIKAIIQRLKAKKAPGIDGLKNICLKHLPRKGLVYLTKIYNACLKLCYFPQQWKHARVIPIAKPNKDITKPVNYRPISLLSTLSKIFERVILTRLNRHLDNHEIIPNEQFGFRRSHSSNHQLVRITNCIKKGFNERKSTGMVMLDVEKAYDTVWQEAVVYKMAKANFPVYLTRMVHSFLKNRSFQVAVNGELSGSYPIPFGVPQGSVLSPTLYNIYTADIIKVDGVSYAFFADDTGYFVTHRDPKVITQKLQEAQQCLEHFQKRWKIKVNAAKTQAVYFTRNRSLRLLPDVCIEVNGHHVPWDTEAKYLGLLMDSKLKFDKHINMSLTKCDKLTRSLYALVKRQSRLQLHNKLLLFKGVFRAVLTYGSPAWMTCAAMHRRRLQLKQNKLLKMILNRAPWYRTEDLHVEANMETVDQFINRIWEKFRASCQLSINPLIEGILND